MAKALIMIVEGRVQAVGYRAFISRNAKLLGIKGYAKNLFDGKVEILAIGDNDIMADFIRVCKKGPSFAWVYNIQYQEIQLEKEYCDFEIKY